jgi:hypothetical protein
LSELRPGQLRSELLGRLQPGAYVSCELGRLRAASCVYVRAVIIYHNPQKCEIFSQFAAAATSTAGRNNKCEENLQNFGYFTN